MGLITTISLLLGGEAWSPVDLVSPEAIAIRVRMLFLTSGMESSDAKSRLGLADRGAALVVRTGAGSTAVYPIGRTHKLYIHSRTEWKNKMPVLKFEKAELHMEEFNWPPWKR
jgi:hypothetical protein